MHKEVCYQRAAIAGIRMATLWRRRTNKAANHLEKVSTDFIFLAGQQECDTPAGCLLYSAPASGNFNASMLVSNVSVRAQLKAWNVPSGMWIAFELAALTSSADFQTFDFTLNPHIALFQAHVGTLPRGAPAQMLTCNSLDVVASRGMSEKFCP